MTAQDTGGVVLTPDQRRRLGHVYRLILGWRREHKNRVQKSTQPTTTEGQAQAANDNTDPTNPIKGEA